MQYQQQQLKVLEEQNMRIRQQQMERQRSANAGGGYSASASGADGYVLDPETGMMIPSNGGAVMEDDVQVLDRNKPIVVNLGQLSNKNSNQVCVWNNNLVRSQIKTKLFFLQFYIYTFACLLFLESSLYSCSFTRMPFLKDCP